MAQAVAPERLRMRDTFEQVCLSNPEWLELAAQKRDAFVRRIERSCFEVTINSCIEDGIDRLFGEKKFVERYSSNCSRVMSNLYKEGSVGGNYLIGCLISGKIDPYNIASLPPRDLCPAASATERAEIELRQNQKFVNKVSRAYICRKCNGNETIPIEFQARSSDEGSTYSIKCVNCEFVWRR